MHEELNTKAYLQVRIAKALRRPSRGRYIPLPIQVSEDLRRVGGLIGTMSFKLTSTVV